MKRVLVLSMSIYLGCWLVGRVLKAEAAEVTIEHASEVSSGISVASAEPDQGSEYWSLFVAASSAQ